MSSNAYDDVPNSELVARAVAKELTAARLKVWANVVEFCYHPLPRIKLQELRQPRATVRDTGEQITRVSRSQTQHDYSIEVCLRRQVDCDKETAMSNIKKAMQDVRDYFVTHTLAERAERFIRVDSADTMDDNDFNELQVVKGTAVLIFRGYKELY